MTIRPAIYSTRRSLLAGAILALMAATSHAAIVNWGAATAITGDTDVSTNGTGLAAYNLGGPGSSSGGPGGLAAVNAIVNGVTFLPFAVDGSSNTFTLGSNYTLSTPSSSDPIAPADTLTWQSLSPDYEALLTSAAILKADREYTLTISGLTAGQTYEFQTWVNNSQRAASDFSTSVGDGLGNEVSLYAGDNEGSTPVPGEYVIGTFTADAATQTITYGSGEVDGLVNGFQLRQLPSNGVPEPASILAGLLPFGVCAVGFISRRRSVKG